MLQFNTFFNTFTQGGGEVVLWKCSGGMERPQLDDGQNAGKTHNDPIKFANELNSFFGRFNQQQHITAQSFATATENK